MAKMCLEADTALDSRKRPSQEGDSTAGKTRAGEGPRAHQNTAPLRTGGRWTPLPLYAPSGSLPQGSLPGYSSRPAPEEPEKEAEAWALLPDTEDGKQWQLSQEGLPGKGPVLGEPPSFGN